MSNKYADIIHLPHHVSKTRPQMAISDRAAQFSPFAALTGYDVAIEEAGKKHIIKMETKEGEKYYEDYGECLPYGREL